VEGNGENAQKFRAQEPKSHKAYEGFAFEPIQLNSTWNQSSQQGRINFIIQHHQIAPLGGKKYATIGFNIQR
jgi:hypothetical protein